MLAKAAVQSSLSLIENSTQSLKYFAPNGNENFNKDSLYLKNFFPLEDLNSKLEDLFSWGETRLYLLNNLLTDEFVFESSNESQWMIAVLHDQSKKVSPNVYLENSKIIINGPEFFRGTQCKLRIESTSKELLRVVVYCTSDVILNLKR